MFIGGFEYKYKGINETIFFSGKLLENINVLLYLTYQDRFTRYKSDKTG